MLITILHELLFWSPVGNSDMTRSLSNTTMSETHDNLVFKVQQVVTNNSNVL